MTQRDHENATLAIPAQFRLEAISWMSAARWLVFKRKPSKGDIAPLC